MKTQFHTFDLDQIYGELKTSSEGLSPEETIDRLSQYGPNELVEKKKKTSLEMFLDQFKDFMILVLIAAAVISGFIGELSDTIAIVVIVILNAVIGFVQEYRAEKAMAALKKMAAPFATVIRERKPATISASELVPGDIVILEAGKIVPADIRLIETAQLKIEEAPLTGESVPAEKDAARIDDDHAAVGDRKNMAYRGTSVTYGRGKGVVVATGMETELGKIAAMLQKEKEGKTPLQKRLASFGKKLAIVILAICAIVFCVGLFRGEPALLMLLTAISLAVAAIPEALPAVVTISLAISARNMVKQNSLIRKLPAVETLGSVTYICTDKTGTLTMNKMEVEDIYVDERSIQISSLGSKNLEQTEPVVEFFRALALSNDADTNSEGVVIGDPTEAALFNFAARRGFDKSALAEEFPRVGEIPFESERKCMTTFHKFLPGQDGRERFVSFTKGAADVLVERSETILTAAGPRDIDRKKVIDVNDGMAKNGLRVLCIAMKLWDNVPGEMISEKVESELVILGLVGMFDPPREEAAEAVSLCKSAGIKPVMITGDHPVTARSVAKRLDIIGNDGQSMITGSELQKLTLEEFEDKVEHIRVYARVAPEQKLKIVQALQDKGQFVAMTGDGVNDAPALKRADIGIAMGITGTDVSKEAADMILLDDNFATVVKAVKEGRRIFDNIRKFVKYMMTSNSGEIWTIFLAPFLGLPIPLWPIQILWINLVTDGLPGLALAAEPAEKGIMNIPPRHPKESIFANGLGVHIFWVGLLMGGVTLITQAWTLKAGNPHWQTMVFTVLCLSQMGHVLAVRSERESLFSQGIFTNKPLVGAFLLTLALQMMIIYVPFFNPIFKTTPLPFPDLMITLALSCIVFVVVEIEKVFVRKGLYKH